MALGRAQVAKGTEAFSPNEPYKGKLTLVSELAKAVRGKQLGNPVEIQGLE
jgi:hypothetical protein